MAARWHSVPMNAQTNAQLQTQPQVLRLSGADVTGWTQALSGLGVDLKRVADGQAIPASFWGEGEAGVIGRCVYARGDTPLHSILHTAAHVLCMDEARRARLHTDCGSDDAEEEAVCYLEVLLADRVPGYDRQRLFADMDAWGYHFRSGSAAAWFAGDTDDARQWLQTRGLI